MKSLFFFICTMFCLTFITETSADTVNWECPFGGVSIGGNCKIYGFENPVVIDGVEYWVDVDPGHLGVYYAQVHHDCPYGGEKVEGNCEIFVYKSGDLHWGTTYWVLTDPPWPGVYYKPSDGKCPFGGKLSGWGNNCEITVFELPESYVERGIDYWVDTEQSPGVYYAQRDGECPDGGKKVDSTCQVVGFEKGFLIKGVKYWVNANPEHPGVYYKKYTNPLW
jgi:hypothetical protein